MWASIVLSVGYHASAPTKMAAEPAEGHRDWQGPHVDYINGKDLVVCACANCGATAMYRWLYEALMDQNCSDTDVDNRFCTRQDLTFNGKSTASFLDEQFNSSFSIALIRDPETRLIAAWKDKLACGLREDAADARQKTRKSYGEDLFKLEGKDREFTTDEKSGEDNCVTLDDFSEILYNIHKANKDDELDQAFRGQDQLCFAKHPADEWSAVTTIDDDDAIEKMSAKVDSKKTFDFAKRDWLGVNPKEHEDKVKMPKLSDKAKERMGTITEKEHKALDMYLKEKKKVSRFMREEAFAYGGEPYLKEKKKVSRFMREEAFAYGGEPI